MTCRLKFANEAVEHLRREIIELASYFSGSNAQNEKVSSDWMIISKINKRKNLVANLNVFDSDYKFGFDKKNTIYISKCYYLGMYLYIMMFIYTARNYLFILCIGVRMTGKVAGEFNDSSPQMF